MRRIALCVLLVAACGQPDPDFDLDGVGVALHTSDRLHWAPEAPARIERVIQASLRYWDAPRSRLHGWVIVYQDEAVDCWFQHDIAGCTDPYRKVITVRRRDCLEKAILPHEIGHARHGWDRLKDALHIDDRFDDANSEVWKEVAAGQTWETMRGCFMELGGAGRPL